MQAWPTLLSCAVYVQCHSEPNLKLKACNLTRASKLSLVAGMTEAAWLYFVIVFR